MLTIKKSLPEASQTVSDALEVIVLQIAKTDRKSAIALTKDVCLALKDMPLGAFYISHLKELHKHLDAIYIHSPKGIYYQSCENEKEIKI